LLQTKYVVLYLALLDILDAATYKELTKNYYTSIDLTDFLSEMLMLISELAENCAFPPDCFEIVLQQNKSYKLYMFYLNLRSSMAITFCFRIFLKMIGFIAATVRMRCSEPFNEPAYRCLFNCIGSFICQKALQVENFDADKKKRMLRQ